MMSKLLNALGEHGAASEDLEQIVANGGVLLAGTGLVQAQSADLFFYQLLWNLLLARRALHSKKAD